MSEITQVQDTRRTFVHELLKLMEKDDKVVMVTCDVGFNYLNEVQEKFPDRYYNLGVTEQSTVMICVGMALSGLKPYFYSMVPFVLFRPYEMVRNGVVHHKANVKLMGVKGSTSYKFLGFSHNMTDEDEDLNAARALGLRHFRCVSNDEVQQVMEATYDSKEAAYIRL